MVKKLITIILTIAVFSCIVLSVFMYRKSSATGSGLSFEQGKDEIASVKDVTGYSKYAKIARKLADDNEYMQKNELYELQYKEIKKAADDDGNHLSTYYIYSIIEDVNINRE